MIILLVLLGAGALGALLLSVLWTQVHPVIVIAVGVAVAVGAARWVARATEPGAPTTGSAKRKHDQFLAAWAEAGHDTDPAGPAAAWRAAHATTGVVAADWIDRHHPKAS